MNRIEQLKEFTGIKLANCFTCACGSADSDGEPGATIYCGMVCSKRDNEDNGSYIEDDGLDAEAEKPCWEPEFWAAREDTNFPIDGTDESVMAAVTGFQDKIKPFGPAEGYPSCPS